MQYFKPEGEDTWVGDCMPFFHDETFHLFYLLDRDHHQADGGLGGHQWAHATTTDLIHWTHHRLAVPLTEEWEGSRGRETQTTVDSSGVAMRCFERSSNTMTARLEPGSHPR